jgi:hypothetical protein
MNTSCTAVSDLLVVDMFETFLRHVLHFFPPCLPVLARPSPMGGDSTGATSLLKSVAKYETSAVGPAQFQIDLITAER